MIRPHPDAWQPQGIDFLEENAWTALREVTGSVCVTAGAGAGKTEFLAQKAAYLLQTGLCPAPKRILAISFKRDAARNLELRVVERCGAELARRFDAMTFDGLTKSMLDRFRGAVPAPFTPPANYRIVFPTRRDYEQFLREVNTDLNAQAFPLALSRTRLPVSSAKIPEQRRAAITAFWRAHYRNVGTGELSLSFPMINRLVELLLRTNPEIRKALHLTYPFVFLDEFQDTTVAQFQLIVGALHGSGAALTAVGDDKQRIMGWAGAMKNGFAHFAQAFDAKIISLELNWRSHEDLVAIQRVIAAAIDPQTAPAQARGIRTVEGDLAAIWEYDSRREERADLAEWISNEVASGVVQPHDIAILVRFYADRVEEELAPSFAARGLALRNLARLVGSIAIQDLLCEDMTLLFLSLLRLGTSNREPDAWLWLQTHLPFLYGLSPEDEAGQQRLQQKLEHFARALRSHFSDNAPGEGAAREALRITSAFVGLDDLRSAYPEYARDDDFERVRFGFETLLIECVATETTWAASLDRFEGRGQVPVMTVHKSKGLEFHTMIFFGLDSTTWRSLDRQDDEELNTFFVALTRAQQRAFFTSCSGRGTPIGWIEELLASTGVTRQPRTII